MPRRNFSKFCGGSPLSKYLCIQRTTVVLSSGIDQWLGTLLSRLYSSFRKNWCLKLGIPKEVHYLTMVWVHFTLDLVLCCLLVQETSRNHLFHWIHKIFPCVLLEFERRFSLRVLWNSFSYWLVVGLGRWQNLAASNWDGLSSFFIAVYFNFF